MAQMLPPIYGLQCTCNSYNSYHRYTRAIKMLYLQYSDFYMLMMNRYAVLPTMCLKKFQPLNSL